MTEFEVLHAYRASRDGRQFGPWKPGDVVELAEDDAAWVNRDSPGCLKAMRAKPAGRDRQHRAGANRSGS